jgi:hypothetical protein
MKDHSHADSVVFFYSGHGEADSLVGEDGKRINIPQFITGPLSSISVDDLYGKPRLFFFDCCRGNTFDDKVRVDAVLGSGACDL